MYIHIHTYTNLREPKICVVTLTKPKTHPKPSSLHVCAHANIRMYAYLREPRISFASLTHGSCKCSRSPTCIKE